LVPWVVCHLVNREDRHGGYNSIAQVRAGYVKGLLATRGRLTLKRLVWHFRVARRADIIGLHAIAPDNTCKWAAWDFDNKEKDEDTRRRNYRAAKRLYHKLTRRGLRPLLFRYGLGSYHLLVIAAVPVPADRLRRWMFALGKRCADVASTMTVCGARAEVFPKSDDIRKTDKQIGNWLRLFGKHHRRAVWPRVYDGKRWLEDHAAIDHLLTLTANDVAALLPPPPPRSRGRRRQALAERWFQNGDSA
jgi:hypothetical protein